MTTTTHELIAHRSTRGQGVFAKARWTELSVFFIPNPGPGERRFMAETKGCSDHKGERERIATLFSDSLDRALDHFRNDRGELSTPGRMVADQAHVWAENNADRISAAGSGQPGVYSDAQREKAIDALVDLPMTSDSLRVAYGAAVDAVAAALGMRKAG